MSENVIIDGFASGIEDWASEETLSSIAEMLNSYLGKSKKDSKDTKKGLDNLVKATKDGDKINREGNEILKGLREDEAKRAKAKDRTKNILRGPSAEYIESIKSSKEGLSSFKTGLGEMSKKSIAGNLALGAFGFAVNGAMAAVEALVDSLLSSIKGYTTAFKSGLTFTNMMGSAEAGMKTFVSAANLTNMSMQELGELTGDYARAINEMGLGAFAKTSRTVSKFGKEFGLTAQESAEYLAGYIEQQRLQGTLDRLQGAEAAKRAKANLEAATHFSQILGLSADAMQKEMNARSESVEMQRALLNVNVASKDALNLAMNGMSESMKEASLDMLSVPEGMETKSESYQNMVRLGMQKTAAQMVELTRSARNGTLTQEEAASQMLKLNKQAAQEYEANKGFINQVSVANAELGGFGKDIGIHAKQYIESAKDKDKAEKNGYAKSMSLWQDTIKRFTNFFDRVLGDMITDEFIKNFNSALTEVENIMAKLATDFKSSGFMEAIPGLLNELPGLFEVVVKGFRWLGEFMSKVAQDGIMSAVWNSDNISEDLDKKEKAKKTAKYQDALKEAGVSTKKQKWTRGKVTYVDKDIKELEADYMKLNAKTKTNAADPKNTQVSATKATPKQQEPVKDITPSEDPVKDESQNPAPSAKINSTMTEATGQRIAHAIENQNTLTSIQTRELKKGLNKGTL